jgi:carbon-monoxide dehydrogenase small subunit
MSLEVEITVNGAPVRASIEDRLLLVQFIREVAGLKATNIGCDTTSCGACTVLLDGRSVKSCTVLAAQADGSEVTTIEGLSPLPGEGSGPPDMAGMHPVQRAFHEHHGLQCGYCTPGMVMAVAGLIAEAEPGSLDEESLRLGLEGNLCRCTGYHNIIEAAMAAAREAGVAKRAEH